MDCKMCGTYCPESGKDKEEPGCPAWTSKEKRVVTGEWDCCECLCRVCARNTANDSWNHEIEYEGKDCDACDRCRIGKSLIVDVDTDCPKNAYLPDKSVELGECHSDTRSLIDFAKFVAQEVCNEDFSDYAKSFAEIAKRRLYRLGFVEVEDFHWEVKDEY